MRHGWGCACEGARARSGTRVVCHGILGEGKYELQSALEAGDRLDDLARGAVVRCGAVWGAVCGGRCAAVWGGVGEWRGRCGARDR